MSALRREVILLSLIPLILAFVVALWVSNPGIWRGDARSQIIDSAERLVRSQLRDPDSAKFRGVSVSPDGKTVCGEVNAKNSFGGYVGYKEFLSFGEFIDIAKEGEQPYLTRRRREVCRAGSVTY